MQASLFEEEPLSRPDIEVRVSTKRRKTVAAYWEGERIVIVFPQRVPKRDRQAYVDELAAKLIAGRAKARPTDAELHARAAYLSRTYLHNAARPMSVQWSTRQNSRWGSCTAADGSIRISARLQGAPQFVVDAVLVHELAHLVHSDHSSEFYELANRFPRQRDADLFLKGLSFGLRAGSDHTGS
ncbi:MAG TPA: SprT-like domain-containing protein [Acidimicrobiales bacterium]|nr:SprT-like domain-containing protein [Acidimicrobiales bacterium]